MDTKGNKREKCILLDFFFLCLLGPSRDLVLALGLCLSALITWLLCPRPPNAPVLPYLSDSFKGLHKLGATVIILQRRDDPVLGIQVFGLLDVWVSGSLSPASGAAGLAVTLLRLSAV